MPAMDFLLERLSKPYLTQLWGRRRLQTQIHVCTGNMGWVLSWERRELVGFWIELKREWATSTLTYGGEERAREGDFIISFQSLSLGSLISCRGAYWSVSQKEMGREGGELWNERGRCPYDWPPPSASKHHHFHRPARLDRMEHGWRRASKVSSMSNSTYSIQNGPNHIQCPYRQICFVKL